MLCWNACERDHRFCPFLKERERGSHWGGGEGEEEGAGYWREEQTWLLRRSLHMVSWVWARISQVGKNSCLVILHPVLLRAGAAVVPGVCALMLGMLFLRASGGRLRPNRRIGWLLWATPLHVVLKLSRALFSLLSACKLVNVQINYLRCGRNIPCFKCAPRGGSGNNPPPTPTPSRRPEREKGALWR